MPGRTAGSTEAEPARLIQPRRLAHSVQPSASWFRPSAACGEAGEDLPRDGRRELLKPARRRDPHRAERRQRQSQLLPGPPDAFDNVGCLRHAGPPVSLQRPRPRAASGLDCLRELLPLPGSQGPQRNGDRVGPGRTRSARTAPRFPATAMATSAAPAFRRASITTRQSSVTSCPATERRGPVAAGCGDAAREDRGDVRLVDLHHEPGPGNGGSHLAPGIFANPCSEGSGDVAAGAIVDQGTLAVMEVEPGGQAEGTPKLDLELMAPSFPPYRRCRPAR